MTLSVIGAGYVGLVTAAVFSEIGNKVFCLDVDKNKIEKLKRGQVPFYEPQLEEYIKRNIKTKRLNFTSSYRDSIAKSQIILVCVGTPSKEDGEADLSFLFSAVEEAARNLNGGYKLIAIKSTIPLGYEDDLERAAKKHAKGKFEFASSPEFLREGTAIEDSLHPDRIVIGTNSKKAQKALLELHAPLSGERIICDSRSAQLIKYASNSLLATKISFANAIASICEATGADVEKVLEGVGADKRLGRSYLFPGVGYGGSCLPKDVQAFVAIGRQFDYDFELLRAVHQINQAQIDKFINKIRTALNAPEKDKKDLKGKKIAILGLSFKPNTDDIREAPAIKIIERLQKLGASINAYDPKANSVSQKILPKVKYTTNAYEASTGCDALLLLTEWPEFLTLDYKKIKEGLKKPIIVDGRNALDREKLIELGFEYIGVGR